MSGTHGAPGGGKSGKGARQRAAEIVGRIAVAAWKVGTAQPQNLPNAEGREALGQQRARDPQVHDAPVRRLKSRCNLPAAHPGLVDLLGNYYRDLPMVMVLVWVGE